jgi:hypothetical protein
VRVALLAATYGLNLPLEPADAWMVEVIDLDRLLDQAAQARADGAEFVIVSLHHGIEYQVPISDNQRLRADTLLASDDVDLLLGHHAHVVQAIERVGDKVAVHGMGNIVSDMKDWETGPDTEDGVVVLLEVVEQADAGRFVVEDVAVVPTWVDRGDGHRIVDVGAALAGEDLSGDRRAALERSFQRTMDAIDRKGASTWGVAATRDRLVREPPPTGARPVLTRRARVGPAGATGRYLRPPSARPRPVRRHRGRTRGEAPAVETGTRHLPQPPARAPRCRRAGGAACAPLGLEAAEGAAEAEAVDAADDDGRIGGRHRQRHREAAGADAARVDRGATDLPTASPCGRPGGGHVRRTGRRRTGS